MPSPRWRDAAVLWRRAEQMGFDSAYTYDHLTWREYRDKAWFSAMPVIAAAAAITSTVRLGTLVASPNFRHPVTLAKETMTLDDISGGRFLLGYGAGGAGFDAGALGQEPWSRAERFARFAESLEQLDTLLSQPRTDRLDGAFYSARDARAIPGCLGSRPPLGVAAAGPRGLRLAALHGQAWITLGHPVWPDDLSEADRWEALSRQSAGLTDACLAAGRDPASIERIYVAPPNRERLFASVEAFDDVAGRLGELGFSEVVVHYPHPGSVFDVGSEEIFERVLGTVLARSAPPAVADPIAENLANWEDRVPIHVASADYGLARYAVDPERISRVVAFDRDALGDLTDLDVVHLQCHIGTDTVSLARLGGRVTGLDFSPAALAAARELADSAGVDVRFVESDVHAAPEALGRGRFDLVYTGVGALNWLPSINRWARVVAALLRPGGRLHLREGHPMLFTIDETRPGLEVRYPYFETPEPLTFDEPTTYTDGDGPIPNSRTHEWNHGLGEIVTALIGAGLVITRLEEHRELAWRALPRMERVERGYRMPAAERDLLPLMFTLQARKPS